MTFEVSTTEATDLIPVEEQASLPEGFRIKDERTANWLVRKVKECRAYADHVRTWAAGEISRAEHEENHLLERFGAQLEKWLKLSLEDEGTQRRSLPLPAGMVALREQPEKVVIVDEGALIAWCKSNLPEAIRVTVHASGDAAEQLARWCESRHEGVASAEAVAKAAVNEHVAKTGELPAGLQLVPPRDALHIR